MTDLKRVIDNIILIEGGYTNNPDDSGGETNFGITIDVARRWGYVGEMINLSREVAFEIYKKRYWGDLNLSPIAALSDKIAEEMLDTGVNMGIGTSAKFLQRALNVFNNRGGLYDDLTVDGKIGPKTVASLNTYLIYHRTDGETVLHRALNCMQGERYISLATKREENETFAFGWFLNRVS